LTAPSPLGWAVEEAVINGFPALRTAVAGGWLLRFSGGNRRTANSATPFAGAAGTDAAVIDDCEALYRLQGRRAIFRIPSFLDPAVDRQLAARGYTEEGLSCILHGPLAPIGAAEAAGGDVRLMLRPTSDWFATMARLQGYTDEQLAVYRRILRSLLIPAAFAEARVGGETAAMAFGVIHRGLVCYESVVTAAAQRRRGHARRVLGALAGWAERSGATGACLQVEADNIAGRTLYAALGMTTELHRYHYRRQPDGLS
jgi:hypothetical protein